MHYEIRRGFNDKYLTPAQRSSGIFAEEPVVLGRVLRRGITKPMCLTAEQFETHQAKLRHLIVAGAIKVFVVNEDQEPVPYDYRATQPTIAPISIPVVDPVVIPPTFVEPTGALTGGAEIQTPPPPATEEVGLDPATTNGSGDPGPSTDPV